MRWNSRNGLFYFAAVAAPIGALKFVWDLIGAFQQARDLALDAPAIMKFAAWLWSTNWSGPLLLFVASVSLLLASRWRVTSRPGGSAQQPPGPEVSDDELASLLAETVIEDSLKPPEASTRVYLTEAEFYAALQDVDKLMGHQRADAIKWMAGRSMILSGSVLDVTSSEHQWRVNLSMNRGLRTVGCLFSATIRSELSKVRRGDVLTVDGVVMPGPVLALERCELVSTSPTR
jgi:hypothetical protein